MAVPTGENPEPRQAHTPDAGSGPMVVNAEDRGTRRKSAESKRPGFLVLGCFGFLVFTGAVILAVGGMALLRVSNAGADFELYQRQPRLFSAALGVALNPNTELLKVDRYRAQLTIRNRQTGKTRTVAAEDLRRDGPQGFGGGQQAGKGGGHGGLLTLFRSGARLLGMGPSLPEWLPSYPGATAGGNMVNETVRGVVGVARFTTSDQAPHVLRFYDQALRSAGFSVTVDQSGVDGTGSISAQSADRSKVVGVRVSRAGGKTSISMTYTWTS